MSSVGVCGWIFVGYNSRRLVDAVGVVGSADEIDAGPAVGRGNVESGEYGLGPALHAGVFRVEDVRELAVGARLGGGFADAHVGGLKGAFVLD